MMNRRLLYSFLLATWLLSGCTGNLPPSPTPTAIVGAGDAAVVFFEQSMYQNLTQQAIDNERIRQAAVMTATQQVIAATATQQTHNENAQATRRAESATERAFEVTVAAAQAADTATAQAHALSVTATVVAQHTATQHAAVIATGQANQQATATADYRTQQAPFEAARLETLRIEQEKAQMELDKAKATMWLSAYGGWVFAVIVAVAAGYVIWKRSQIGVIADENGKVRIVMINKRALSPELMTHPVADFSAPNGVLIPDNGIDPETQRQQAHERNIVDAIKGLPPGYARQGMGLAAGMMQKPAVNIQVIQPSETGLISQWDADIQGQMAQEVHDD